MWLVANDIIIGIALGTFLTANKYVLAERFHDILNVMRQQSNIISLI